MYIECFSIDGIVLAYAVFAWVVVKLLTSFHVKGIDKEKQVRYNKKRK